MTTPERVRRRELAVIRAAYEDHRGGCAPETCGGSRLDPCDLANALRALTFECDACNRGGHTCPGDGNSIEHGDTDCGQHVEQVEQELIWHPRTWADVRPGDTVRLPGSEVTAEVYTAVLLHWNVDPRTGTSSYNPPVAMPHDVMQVRFTHEIEVPPRDMDPVKPVEIQLTRSEVDALDAAGWMNRVGLMIEQQVK